MEQGDIENAIEVARRAQSSWAAKSAKERSTVLKRWNAQIIQHADDIAELMTLECGKPLAEAKGEVIYAASFVEWFAEECKRAYGRTIPSPLGKMRTLTITQPVGVAAMITPWNFPAAMITRKVAPALAAGCATIVKPSEETPLTALALGELAGRAGLPNGLFNVVTTDRAGAAAAGWALCGDPRVRKISFTGSTEVGKLLMAQAAPTVKRVSLELGGNAPFLVFEDADLDGAVAAAMAAKFRNAGQTCVAPNRFLVHRAAADAFQAAVAVGGAGRGRGSWPAMARLRVGDGRARGVTVGSLINGAAVDKVDRLVQDALSKGAQLVAGGHRLGEEQGNGGNFFEPTLLAHVTDEMQCWGEEIFGPVVGLRTFESEEEAVALANATEKGLAAYFCTRDIGRAWRVAERLEVGMVGLNEGIISLECTPFGGVKESGLGREGAHEGLEEYLETKYIAMGGLSM
ncbi:unnamed protein product [Heterosigma akashiwo]